MTSRKQLKKATTLIIDAVLEGDASRVEAALRAGNNVDDRDADGRTALHHACIEGDEALVHLLLRFNANPAVFDNNGMTPLHFAARNYQVSIAQKLLQSGAPADAVDSHGNTALSDAVFESRGRGELIRLLLQAGADRHKKNNHGVSPASLASTIANHDVMQWFKP